MANSSHNRAFHAYNSDNYENRPPIKQSSPVPSSAEPLIFARIPSTLTKIKSDSISSVKHSATPRSISMHKPIPSIQKRRLSTASLGPLLPSRKGLPMTALATKRQNLWMSIAKNAPANNTETPLTSIAQPTQHQSLLRKKILRLLLVFSYLVSISLFAIALATFYGFFWSGYSTSSTEAIATSTSIIYTDITKSNSTLITTYIPDESEKWNPLVNPLMFLRL